MDVGRAFQYIADDEKWLKKLLIGMVVSLIPILSFAAFGYVVQVTQNVAAGMERPLPDWNRLGRYLKNGLRVVLVLFIYALPIVLFMFCSFMIIIISVAVSPDGEPPPALMVVFPLMMLCLLPFSLLVGLMFPAVFIQVARRESLLACLQPREMWQMMTAKLDSYILIIALYFGLNMLAGFITMPFSFTFMFLPTIGGTSSGIPDWFLGVEVLLLWGGIMTVSVLARFLVFLVVAHLEGQYIRQIDGTSEDVMRDA
ncbi:MAG TPA: DUF4013 domain-containing protein [Anaerolineae bacterium]|nr:DUF4013 domain-containing protein [Anaerolineae bacterium]